MTHRVKSIDYLRGISIISIIIIHVLAWHDKFILTEYTKVPLLFALRDILQFSVISIIICSSFSLYISHKNMKFNRKSIFDFYKKRIKRLILPWWTFLIIFFIFHGLIRLIFGVELIEFSIKYVLSSFFMVGGIGIGWIILLLLFLSLLFPILKKEYLDNKKIIFGIYTLIYLVTTIYFYSKYPNIFNIDVASSSILWIASAGIAFISGWILMYLIGFLIEEFYTKKPTGNKETTLILRILFAFTFIYIIYNSLNLNLNFYMNKYPPSPYYISFGLLLSIALITLFFNYGNYIPKIIKKILSFYSFHSYWLFMENVLTISVITYLLSFVEIPNIYLKFLIDISLNLIAVTVLIWLQSKISYKLNITLKKHHFF